MSTWAVILSMLGGDPRIDYLARWDGSKWNPVGNLTQTYGSLNGTVLALAVDGTDLYMGGGFACVYNEGTPVGGNNRIAKWDGSTFSALGGGLSNTVTCACCGCQPQPLRWRRCSPMRMASPAADYIAKWDGNFWSALAGNGSFNGALNGMVRTLAVSGTDLYVGGSFTSVLNTSNTPIANAAYLAKWNGSAWSAMDGITQPVNSHVMAIAVSGSDVYVGGNFSEFNAINDADKIAKWNGSTWSALGNNGLGDGSLNGSVNAIAVNGGNVYAGGNFTNPGNPNSTTLTAGDYLAMWNGSTWSALGNDGGVNGSLNAVVQVPDDPGQRPVGGRRLHEREQRRHALSRRRTAWRSTGWTWRRRWSPSTVPSPARPALPAWISP